MELIKSKTPKIKGLHQVGRYAIGIQWIDGHDSIFPLENIRRGCQCDECRRAGDRAADPSAARLKSFSRLGENAVFAGWADGHESVFTNVALRALCRCAYCVGEPEHPVTGR
jgi:DUF971 family protein